MEDLAARVEGRLTATGVQAYLTRAVSARHAARVNVDEDSRAHFANEARADLFVSLHVDGDRNPAANGVATYYFGTDRFGQSSAIGAAVRLASSSARSSRARTCSTAARTA